MFSFDLSDEMKIVIKKLQKKDRSRVIILNKKIKEIINNNLETIDRYKNLKKPLNDYKRVHIDKSFVLLFNINRKKKHIIFQRLQHHDKIYSV